MELNEITTRRSLIETLAVAGIEGAAAEAIAKETAPARHAFRVQQMTIAAINAIPDEQVDLCDEAQRKLHAWAILALDRMGVGGKHGCEGASSERIPPLAHLGKGKRARSGGYANASDAQAWDVARDAAMCALLNPNNLVWVTPNADEIVFIAKLPDTDSEAVEVVVKPTISTARWMFTLAREGLRRSLDLPPWFPEAPLQFEADAAKQWATLVNFLAVMIAPTVES